MHRRTFLAAALLAGAPLTARIAAYPAGTAVETLARLLAEGYVVPAQGARYAAMLRAKLHAGGYRDFAAPAALGAQLTADLRALSEDRHLRVVPIDSLPAGERPAGGPTADPSAPRAGPSRVPALQDAGWLAEDVAYLRYTGFTGDQAVMTATQAFMRDHAGARALVIDCRYNGGGGIDEMNVFLPYLFAAPTDLVRFEMVDAVARRQGLPFEGPTVRPAGTVGGVVRNVHFVTPREDETRWRGAKLFYLISPRTASAAEHLALAFKHSGRATLIGSATAGANHFGGFEPLGWGLAVFLPVGRTVDLTTGADWEGVGVTPDVAIEPVMALQEALRRAGVAVPT